MEQQKLPPGFRFSPTDEELVVHYLKNRACGKDCHQGVIAEVDIYKHEPWDLPEKSVLPSLDPVWYFFNAQDKRHSQSARINRTTGKGYWKATGKDRKIYSGPHIVGIKKTLIYYEGRAPSGKRTDWIMHEYKLDEDYEKRSKAVCCAALCRIRKKGGPGPRNGEQFGAPVNNEWGEDVDDAVDDLPSGSDVAASFIKRPKEEVLFDTHTEGLAWNDLPHVESVDTHTEGPAWNDLPHVESVDTHTEGLAWNDLPHVESVDTSPELDLYMYLENFLADVPDVTSLEADMVSSTPAIDRTQRNQNDLNAESLLALQDTNVQDILHPTCNEEEILGELLHLTDGSQCRDDMDSVGGFGDYIEMFDMESPLDGLLLRSPRYYGIEQQQLPPDLFDEVESLGCSPDLLENQGQATRRVRLQITPPVYATHRDVRQSGPVHKSHSEVSGSSGLTIQIDSTSNNHSQKAANAFSVSDSNDNIGRSLPESYLGKESLALKTTNFINKIKVQPVISNVVSISPSLLSTTSYIKEASLDCEAVPAGSDTKGGMCATNSNKHSGIQEAAVDCEAGPSSIVVPGKSSKLVHLSSDDGNRDVGQLVSKVKGLTLGSRLVELESNLSTTFNDKVFALGKPVARLFPSKGYVNPYRSLRSGALTSLCHLGLAVLVLFVIFLGIHMLTKYVLSLTA